MPNKRVFYAAKRAGIGPVGSAGSGNPTYRQLHGLQSVGITTTFNLEQTFELGQLAIYENVEGIPDVSIDVEKVMDGYCPIYVLATSISGGAELSSSASLVGRSRSRCDFLLSVHKDSDEIAGGGVGSNLAATTDSHVQMSGVFVSSAGYNVGIDGYATESCTMVGQDKVYFSHTVPGDAPDYAAANYNTAIDLIASEDAPQALAAGSGGVQRREDVLFRYQGLSGGAGINNYFKNSGRPFKTSVSTGIDAGLGDTIAGGEYPASGLGTVLPVQIPGVSTSGTNNTNSAGVFDCLIQSINCSTDFGREDIFQLGRKGRYHRFVNFPTEVSCEVTVVSASGDLISSTEAGMLGADKPGDNLRDETIRLHLREGLLVDLGKKNKLQSVSVTGGDAGGGNDEITYSFQNFNDFTVYHPEDPRLAGQASVILTFSGASVGTDDIILIDAQGNAITYIGGAANSGTTFDGDATTGSTNAGHFETVFNSAAGHGTGGKGSMSASRGSGGSAHIVTLTQTEAGYHGETAITNTISEIGLSDHNAAVVTAFVCPGTAGFSPKGQVFV
jgi:hypothetical protein